MSVLFPAIQLEVLATTTSNKKEYLQIREEEVKSFLFIDNMIISVENPMAFTVIRTKTSSTKLQD